jgi:uncharacterized protein YchJ
MTENIDIIDPEFSSLILQVMEYNKLHNNKIRIIGDKVFWDSGLGRNDPCHCGSNKKYKKCHMLSDMEINK